MNSSKIVKIINDCPLCYNSSIKCSSCEIKHLKRELASVREELVRLSIDRIEMLHLKYYQRLDVLKYAHRSVVPHKFEYESKLSNSYFFTMTFDPVKFGLHPYESERKEYILYTLIKQLKHQLFTECWGSFEYHKNGIIHTHCIIVTGSVNELYRKLQPMYTDKLQNKYAVTFGKAKYPQAEDYITKESTCYYYINGEEYEVKPCISHKPLLMKSTGFTDVEII